MLREGIRLHDQGDYAGAILQYDRIISLNNQYFLAYSEKTFSLFSSGKYQECTDLCKQVLKDFPNDDGNARIYVNYGSAMDALGNNKEAIKIYDEGIRKFPGEHLLYFNRGVTEYAHEEYDPVIRDMEESLRLSSGHPSSHLYLASCMYSRNKIASAMAMVGFLLVEPTGKRAEKNLPVLLGILGQHVTQKNDSNISITLNADALGTKEKGEDDFHLTEFMLAMATAADHTEASKGKSSAQLLENKLKMLAEVSVKNKGFFSNFYVPLLAGLQKAGLLETASHMITLSAKENDNLQWLQDHSDKVKELQAWMGNWENKKK
jgi:tetratricopeptide (TPR) repeat protein